VTPRNAKYTERNGYKFLISYLTPVKTRRTCTYVRRCDRRYRDPPTVLSTLYMYNNLTPHGSIVCVVFLDHFDTVRSVDDHLVSGIVIASSLRRRRRWSACVCKTQSCTAAKFENAETLLAARRSTGTRRENTARRARFVGQIGYPFCCCFFSGRDGSHCRHRFA